MSPLQVKYYLAASVFAMLVVFEVVTRLDDRRKIKSGAARDLRKSDTLLVKHNAVQLPKWRIWAEGLLIIAAGVLMVLTIKSLRDYYVYGAFYDNAWRSPDVEEHLMFSSMAGRSLEDLYVLGPEGYPWGSTNVVLVKNGCEDCERVADAIHSLESEGYVIVFSRSKLGQAYVERYGITYVPSVVLGNSVIQLRSGDSMLPVPDSGEGSGEAAREILDSLLEGYGPPEDGQEGTESDADRGPGEGHTTE